MKITSKIYTLGLSLVLGTFLFACEQTRTETNTEAAEVEVETEAATRESGQEINEAAVEADNEVGEFSTWVRDRSGRAENVTEAEWAETKAEYKRREAELEARSTTWDEKSKREWQDIKADWNRTENKVQSRLKNIKGVDVDVNVEKR